MHRMDKTNSYTISIIIATLLLIPSMAFCEKKINSYEAFGLRKGKEGKLSEAKANLLKAAQESNDPKNNISKKLANTITDAENNEISRETARLILNAQDKANNGQTDKAIEEFKNIISQNPKYAPAYSYLGYIYLSINKKNEAIDAYNNCIKFSPSEDSSTAKEAKAILAELEK